MQIYEVFSRRVQDDPLVHVGSIKAPDDDMALVLAREAFFRHGEGVDCWVAKRTDLHRISNPESLGGVTDRSYRRQDGYQGVGAKAKRVAQRLVGVRIDKARPPRTGGAS